MTHRIKTQTRHVLLRLPADHHHPILHPALYQPNSYDTTLPHLPRRLPRYYPDPPLYALFSRHSQRPLR